MSMEMKRILTISQSEIKDIEQRMNDLYSQGIVATDIASGELNISGCASSSCMAWD